MNELNLFNKQLTELTESDLKALCDLNNIKYNELEELYLHYNKLTNLDFIRKNTSFKNLKILRIANNQITDISNVKYLKKLILLDISELKLDNEKETVNILKTLKKLNTLGYFRTFKLYNHFYLKQELYHIENL